MQSNKHKTQMSHEPRKKLYSLRSLTSHNLPATTLAMQKRSFEQLQRSLNRDNHMEEQPVAQPIAIIPGFEQDIIEGKLWGYFIGKVEVVGKKVEKEQVNCREKQFWIIKQQVSQLQTNYSRQKGQLENIIKEKYKQVHGLFEQIKQERTLKAFTISPKTKKGKKQQPIIDNSQKLVQLKGHVQLIRNDVLNLELQLGKINQDSQKLQREWITFLKQILKGGYYLKDGMRTVLKQMIQATFSPSIEDMPDVLDQTSKKCLIQEYNNLKDSARRTSKVTPIRLERSRILSQARQSLSEIARKNLVREVYKDTQDFMANLVKQADWRTTNIVLPKIQATRKIVGEDWRDHERKRVCVAYNGEDLTKVRGILFGWKVQSNE